jgi:glutathione S-transferase
MSKSISLYQFPRTRTVPNLSPFCMKLETYLRMTHLKYDTITTVMTRKSPLANKLPYIKYGDEFLGDSSLIIARLESDSKIPLDHHIDNIQRAESLCVQRLLEDHLYWVLVYARWFSKEGAPIWAERMKKKMPPIIKHLIMNRAKAGILKELIGHGIGRHSEETIFNMGLSDLEAMNIKMGDRIWYFNDQPSTLDAIIYSFLVVCLSATWSFPLKNFIIAHSNMLRYLNHVQAQYFPEYPSLEKAT